jgi:hypothetical protein
MGNLASFRVWLLGLAARILGVPIQVHQSFFTKGKSVKRC